MRYTILFIITLVVVSGFIAYFGDFLGRKMGKKRLTLFGLRPRHTAIVVTTITGMVIAMLTLATIVSVNTSIREVLVAGEQKIAENRKLQAVNARLQEKEQKLRRDYERARHDVYRAREARDTAAGKVAELRQLIADHIRDLNVLKKKKSLTEAQLAEKARILSKLETDLDVMQQYLAQTNKKLASAQKELGNAVRLFAQQNATIESQKKAMDEYDIQLRDQLTRLESMGLENRRLEVGYGWLRRGNLILKQGQEVTRRVVSQNQSVFSIRAEILSILDEAGAEARKTGASTGSNDRSVVVVAPTIEQECIAAASEAIAKSLTPVIVQVLVISNTFEGEQAAVQLQLYRNDLAFSKGATLASAMIDGRQAEGKILLSVVGFLRSEVRKAADVAGVVPVASLEPEIQGDQLDELMELVSRIKQMNVPVRLKVTAEKDIYAVGPLNLKNLEFSISTVVATATAPAEK